MGLGALCLGAAAAPTQVQVQVVDPAPGVTVRQPVHQARIRGRAAANADAPSHYEIVLALDVSGSTSAASGVDVDRDGQLGFDPHQELLPAGAFPPEVRSTDPDDSILQAQVAAAKALLSGLDPRRVRVAVVSFAGEVDRVTGRRRRVDQQDAWLEVPLTDDFARVYRTLDAVAARGPRGGTNYAAGIRLAVRELAGLSGARSQSRPDARKGILFLTDGTPSLPVGRGNIRDPGDEEAAIRAARLAHEAGIFINTYALGAQALQYPRVLTEMARVTLGSYTPVQNPGDIILLLQGTTFANVEDVVFTNLTTGDFSTDVRLSPDGSFTGYVPVREGRNRVRVSALASDGTRGKVEFEFDFQRSDLPGRDPLAELRRIRRQNKALELHRLEVEIEAFRAEQRKEVEIQAAPR